MCPAEYTRLNPAVFAKAVLHWRESCSTLWWSLCLVKSIICVVSLVPFSASPKDHRAQQSGKLCIQYRLCAWFTAPATFLDAPTSSYIVRMRTADQPTIDTTFSLFFTVASDASVPSLYFYGYFKVKYIGSRAIHLSSIATEGAAAGADGGKAAAGVPDLASAVATADEIKKTKKAPSKAYFVVSDRACVSVLTPQSCPAADCCPNCVPFRQRREGMCVLRLLLTSYLLSSSLRFSSLLFSSFNRG